MEVFIFLLFVGLVWLIFKNSSLQRKQKIIISRLKEAEQKLLSIEILLHSQSVKTSSPRSPQVEIERDLSAKRSFEESSELNEIPSEQSTTVSESKGFQATVENIFDADYSEEQKQTTPPLTPQRQPISIKDRLGEKSNFRFTPKEIKEPKEPSAFSQTMASLSKQFSENFIGVLGTIVVVLGMITLSVYAGLMMDAPIRVAMIMGAGVIIIGGSAWIKSKFEYWATLGSWLQSGGTTLILFACLGSVGIEGLKCISNPILGLVVMTLGLVIHMGIGHYLAKQPFAVFHSIVSLAALSFAPPIMSVFFLAGITTIASLSSGFIKGRQWGMHSVLTLIGFGIFHAIFYLKVVEIGGYTSMMHVQSLGICLIIGIIGVLLHYSVHFREKEFDSSVFASHIVNWILLGLQLQAHALGSKWKTLYLLVAAISVLALSQIARKNKVGWLFKTDAAVSLILFMIMSATIPAWGANSMTAMWCAGALSALFAYGHYFQRERFIFLTSVGVFLILMVSTLPLGGYAFVVFMEKQTVSLPLMDQFLKFPPTTGVWTIAIAITAWIFLLGIPLEKQIENFTDDVFKNTVRSVGILSIIPASIGYILLLPLNYLPIGMTLILGVFVVLRVWRSASKTLYIGLLFSGLVSVIIHIFYLRFQLEASEDLQFTLGTNLLRAIPWMLYPFVLFLGLQKKEDQPLLGLTPLAVGIHLAGFYLGTFLYSPLAIGFYTSIVLALMAVYQHKLLLQENSGVFKAYWLTTWVLILFWVGRHVYVNLPYEESLWFPWFGIKYRFLVEITFLNALVLWFYAVVPIKHLALTKIREYIPLQLELVLLAWFSMWTLEFDAYILTLFWPLCALFFMFLGEKQPEHLSRLRFYALLVFFASAIQIGWLSTNYVSPSAVWYERVWVISSFSIVLMMGFVYLFPIKASLGKIYFPNTLQSLEDRMKFVLKNQNAFLVYPLTLSIAFFLYGTFEKSILTLLFTLECFGLFVLSLLMREIYFKHVALVGLVLCTVRMIFFDLGQKGLITQAFVFIGSGALMIGMNMLYNKYKDRFSEATESSMKE